MFTHRVIRTYHVILAHEPNGSADNMLIANKCCALIINENDVYIFIPKHNYIRTHIFDIKTYTYMDGLIGYIYTYIYIYYM